MDACPTCTITLTSPPALLDCGHINCSACVARGDSESRILCQWSGCGRPTFKDGIRYMTFTPPGGHVTSQAYDPGDKAMDDELVDLAREHGHISGDENMDKETEAKRARRDEGEGSEAEADVGGLRVSDDETVRTLELLEEIEALAQSCEHIRGFYEHEHGHKVVIDVTQGTKDKVAAYLTSHHVPKDAICIAEKRKKILFVATGAKVADLDLFERNDRDFYGRHPDRFHDAAHTATVACLGIDQDDKQYVLTTKHPFGGAQAHGRGKFISSLRNVMTDVSTTCRGVFGTISNNESFRGTPVRYQVDIAALELLDTVTNNLAPHLVRRLKPHFGQGFDDARRQLKGKVVYKQGAISGTTCGVIEDPFYRDRDIPEIGSLSISGSPAASGGSAAHPPAPADDESAFTRCIIIRSEDPQQRFAGPGDSGALIYDDRGTPIAMVAGGDDQHTFAVRLDHCLTALRGLNPPIDIKQCKAIGSPAVPVIPEPAQNFHAAGAQLIQPAPLPPPQPGAGAIQPAPFPPPVLPPPPPGPAAQHHGQPEGAEATETYTPTLPPGTTPQSRPGFEPHEDPEPMGY